MNSRSKVRRSALLALCLTCAVAVPAQAAELGFYVGGSYGSSTRQTDIAKFDALASEFYNFIEYTPATTTRTLDDKGSAYGFVAGYRLLPHLAIEGGYLHMGTASYRAKNTGTFPPTQQSPAPTPSNVNLNVDSKSSGIALSALGILPISYRFEVYARGGVVFATNTVHAFLYNERASQTDETSKSSTNLLAGVGATMSFMEIYALRLEYQRIFDVGESFTGKGDVDMITLGITVGF